LKAIAIFFAFAALAFADASAVLLRQQSGGFLITVFGTPQVGANDFSVLIQNASDHSPVLDAGVDVFVARNMIRATHQQATNKLLYAATIHIHRAGRYSMQVHVSRNDEAGSINGDILVAPAPAPWAAYWPYFALVPAAILLFVLNQYLKNARRRPRRL
jgi:hypothetical protein